MSPVPKFLIQPPSNNNRLENFQKLERNFLNFSTRSFLQKLFSHHKMKKKFARNNVQLLCYSTTSCGVKYFEKRKRTRNGVHASPKKRKI